MSERIGDYNVVIEQKSYKMGAAQGIWAEQEHKLDNARDENKNYRDDLRDRNTTLEHYSEIDKYNNYRDFFNGFREEHGIEGRVRLDDGKKATNVITSFVVGLSTTAYQSMTMAERDEYFRDALDYIKDVYPDYTILDATIHRDEGHYEGDKWFKGQDHLQICAVPTYYNQEKNRVEISTTKAERDFLKKEMEREGRDTTHMNMREQRQYLHDRFVQYNRDRGRDFDDRSTKEKQRHLDVKTYKALKAREREIERERDRQDKERLEKARQKAPEPKRGPFGIVSKKEMDRTKEEMAKTIAAGTRQAERLERAEQERDLAVDARNDRASIRELELESRWHQADREAKTLEREKKDLEREKKDLERQNKELERQNRAFQRTLQRHPEMKKDYQKELEKERAQERERAQQRERERNHDRGRDR